MQQQIEQLFSVILPYQFYIALLLAVLLCRIPFLTNWFRIYDTLLHECGHAFSAMIFGGEMDSISLLYNTSGKTNYSYKSKWTTFFVLISGYTFSSAFGLAMLLLIYRYYSNFAFYAFLIIMLIALVVWVRNVFGIVWLLINIALLSFLRYYHFNFALQFFLILISFILLFESVYATFNLLMISFKGKSSSDDAGMLKKITGIPSSIWSILFFLFSAGCLGCGIYLVIIKQFLV